MKFSPKEVENIAEINGLTPQSFKKNYVIARQKGDSVCIFQATYARTSHSRPSEDGKLRDIQTDLYWLTVGEQHILPKPNIWKFPPLTINIIYT